VVQGSEDEKNKFVSNVLSFINTNREYYWMIPSVKNRLKDWEVKIDDEGLELSIHSLQINGRDLSYNPYQEYRLFYNWREEKFSFEESDMDPRGFFQTLIDAYYDLDAYEDAANLSEEEWAILLRRNSIKCLLETLNWKKILRSMNFVLRTIVLPLDSEIRLILQAKTKDKLMN